MIHPAAECLLEIGRLGGSLSVGEDGRLAVRGTQEAKNYARTHKEALRCIMEPVKTSRGLVAFLRSEIVVCSVVRGLDPYSPDRWACDPREIWRP